MPLPGSIAYITVHGTFQDSGGNPSTGSITFAPPPILVDPGSSVIYSRPVSANLDSTGAFSVSLVCTDNIELVPPGWSYTVTERITGSSSRAYQVFLPHSLGASVDFSNVTPIPSVTGAPAIIPSGVVAPGYGGLAYNQTWTGTNTFSGPVVFSSTVTGVGVIDGVTVTGTPTAGQVLTATSASAATWQVSTGGGGGGGSGVQIGGDIGGTNTVPTVIATHLGAPLPLAQGGTGQGTAQSALTALAGTQSAGKYLRSDGTNTALATIQAADVPVLNQSTTGTSSNITGIALIANGGTGQSTQAAALTALTGAQSAGAFVRSDGTNAALSAIQASDVPVLNQATTGTASNVTGTVAIGHGGTGQVTAQAAVNALTGAQSAGRYLRSDGTNATLAAIQANDVPVLNQSTTGTAAGLSATLAVGSGGTGQTSATAAFNALSPVTALGDMIYGSAANTASRLAGSTSATKGFLVQTGTGTVSAAPAWGAIQAADVPVLNQNTTGTAANVTGTVALANGGTGQVSAQAALNALAGAQTAGRYLRGDGTNVTLAAVQVADIPTLNQNTTGTAANVTGVVAVANGGTGANNAATACTNLGAANRLTPTAVKTAAYTAQAGDLVIIDATSGSVPVTLVSAPADGTVIGVKMVTTASSHTAAVTCGGTDVFNKTGGATVATLSLTAQAILLQYLASSGVWYVVGDDLPLTQLDTRYVAKLSPVTLTDGATIATDASLSNLFRVTLGGNRTLSNPTNPTDGQLITWSLKQDATGSRTITLDTKFRFGTDITSITLTTTASKTDHLGARYNATDDKYDVVAFVRGF